MGPVVIFPDPQLVAITHLKAVVAGATVSSEPPGPDEFDAALPVVIVTALPSPPMPNKWALSAARLFFEVIARDQPTANQVANVVNAHVRSLGGGTVPIVGGNAVVSTVRNTSSPESGDDTNTNYRTSGFSAELLLRPLRAT